MSFWYVHALKHHCSAKQDDTGNLILGIDALQRNRPTGLEHGSRPVSLGRPRLFGYGTTDVIIGYADASTIVSNNDFVLRDEYDGGPDGCAIDLETDCHNLTLG